MVAALTLDNYEAPGGGTELRQLGRFLGNDRWIRRTEPFPHLVAYDVFTPEIYSTIERAFYAAVEPTQGQAYLEKHDIKGRTLTPDIAAGFEPLISWSWNECLSRALSVETTGHLEVGLHHHDVGSSHGFPHNDFNPGWFNGWPEAGEVILGDDSVEYTTGVPRRPHATPVETVRAASLLFYLGNPAWEPEDGGMTGLYSAADDDIEQPSAFAAPINNSLLVFECTPYSFHGFVSNYMKPRNSIVMWLHQTRENAVYKWGDTIVPYGSPPALRRPR